MGKTGLTILYIMGASVALLLFVYFGLNWYTDHGDFVVVPNVKGKSLYDAKNELKNYDLDYIIADSTFDESKPPLSVLEQQPLNGAKVKENRRIYLTLNASAPPSVKIPSIIDNSRRQAELILNSWGLKLGQLIYIPDMAKDAVLNIQVNGKIVKPGTVVPKGTMVDLVLGDGFGNQVTEVPPITDMTVLEARAVLEAVHLNVGEIIAAGPIEDTLSAYVYDQNPKFGQPGQLGANNSVQLYIRQQKSDIAEPEVQAAESNGMNKLVPKKNSNTTNP
ncbi:MAG TPA: PASTA domain-containing protein [Chitinophagales bacterium]|nr:PASTA domain-containing protein [Chitinophagales bacterium]HMW11564.1 PASTA domain-containing protein [Chitinophagales bacterium]HMX60893.1 PASTA domain-containing protein [Chitinophagales bacterium]HMY23394.1 PASTA domain-containing protein [Chitinophagales bacterium]HMZ32599.1 PASTA domain-containing protein [Chitinophagales bacterium]